MRFGGVLLCVLAVLCGCASPATEAGADDTAALTDSADSNPAAGADGGCLVDADCDDGSPCTVDRRCVDGGCTAGLSVCWCQEDADCKVSNRCLGAGYCDKSNAVWRCRVDVTAAIACDTSKDDICSVTACDPADGKCTSQNAPALTACEDGQPCTTNDTCKSGKCVGGNNDCGCSTDADCAALDDGNPCNGTVACHKNTFPWSCAPVAGSIPQCDTDSTNPCVDKGCNPKDGDCGEWAGADGQSCDDGDACTASDKCLAGACKGTEGSCVCTTDADCAALDDGNLCNGVPTCKKTGNTGFCQLDVTPPPACDPALDSDCVKNACRPETGLCVPTVVDNLVQLCVGKDAGKTCTWVLADATSGGTAAYPCDDGDACTSGEVCAAGKCGGGKNGCGCTSDADCASSDKCAGVRFCNLATQQCGVKPATIVQCPTAANTACLKNACSPSDGTCAITLAVQATAVCDVLKSNAPAACRWVKLAQPKASQSCEDGDPCTTDDACDGATCKPGKIAIGEAGCSCASDADCTAADKCAGTAFCNKATKKCATNPGSAIKCPTANDTQCARNACDPSSGQCEKVALEWSDPVCLPGEATQTCRRVVRDKAAGPAAVSFCEDGSACTLGDVCGSGVCESGVQSCQCQSDADCAAFDDGNLCNGTMRCDKSDLAKPICTPKPGSVVTCPPLAKAGCAKAACDPTTGACAAVPLADGVTCSDNSACTSADHCESGACVATPVDCSDDNACTQDSCDPTGGCVWTLKVCDDGNGCTVDKCDKTSGKCSFDANAAHGLACDADGNPCTVNDACQLGGCVVGKPLQCPDDGQICTDAVCIPNKSGTSCVQLAKPNGTNCDDEKSCTVGDTCKGGKCAAGPKKRLFYGWLTTKDTGATHVAVLPGGGVLFGTRRDTVKGPRNVGVVVTDGAKVLSQMILAPGVASENTYVRRMIGETDGVRAFDRTLLNGRLTARATRQVISGAGTVVGQPAITALLGTWTSGQAVPTRVADVARDGDGAIVAVGERLHPDQPDNSGTPSRVRPAIWRFPLTGAPATLQPWDKDRDVHQLGRYKAVSPAKKGFYVAGTFKHIPKDKQLAEVRRLDANGPRWVVPLARQGIGDMTTIGAVAADLGVLVGLSDDTPNGRLDRVSGDGRLLWHRTVHSARIDHLVPDGPDGALAVLYIFAGDPRIATSLLRRLNHAGGVVSQRTLGTGSRIHGIARIDRRLAIVGTSTYDNLTTTTLVAAVDLYGNAQCSTSGSCYGLDPGDCDDGKACHTHDCFTGLCRHVPAGLKQCAPDEPCALTGECVQQKCKPTLTRVGNTNHTSEVVADKARMAGAWRDDRGGITAAYGYGLGASVGYQLLHVTPDGTGTFSAKHTVGLAVRVDGKGPRHAAVVETTGGLALLAMRPELEGLQPNAHALCNNCDVQGLAYTSTPDEGAVVAHHSWNLPYDTMWVERVGFKPTTAGTTYTKKWTLKLTTPSTKPWESGALQRQGQSQSAPLLFTGIARLQTSKKLSPVVSVISMTGKVTSTYVGQPALLKSAFAAHGSNKTVLFWRESNSFAEASWWDGISPQGKLTARYPVSWPARHTTMALRTHTKDRWLAVGVEDKAGAPTPWIAQVDDRGMLQWRREFGKIAAFSLLLGRAPLVGPAGEISMVLGATPAKATKQTLVVVRTDAYGHVGCAASGSCVAKKPSDCDDANPCTTDACSAKTGCTHVAIFGCKKDP